MNGSEKTVAGSHRKQLHPKSLDSQSGIYPATRTQTVSLHVPLQTNHCWLEAMGEVCDREVYNREACDREVRHREI